MAAAPRAGRLRGDPHRDGGGGATTRLICGYLACDARLAAILLAGLPPVVQVSVRGSNAGVCLEASLRYALAEMLFIEVLRIYMNDPARGSTGWLAGVSDRIVGAALRALHAEPAHPWTLESLARASGTSRPVLAERFALLVGQTPMQYLAQWRLLLASNLPTRSNAPLARIAEEVGTRPTPPSAERSAASTACRRPRGGGVRRVRRCCRWLEGPEDLLFALADPLADRYSDLSEGGPETKKP